MNVDTPFPDCPCWIWVLFQLVLYLSREQAVYGIGGTNGGGHVQHGQGGCMLRTLVVIVGTAIATIGGIALFLKLLFNELEKYDDHDGF